MASIETPVDEQIERGTCRICLSEESGYKGDALVKPCACKGTSAHVHASCLIRWQIIKTNNTTKCGTCKMNLFEIDDIEKSTRHDAEAHQQVPAYHTDNSFDHITYATMYAWFGGMAFIYVIIYFTIYFSSEIDGKIDDTIKEIPMWTFLGNELMMTCGCLFFAFFTWFLGNGIDIEPIPDETAYGIRKIFSVLIPIGYFLVSLSFMFQSMDNWYLFIFTILTMKALFYLVYRTLTLNTRHI